MALPDALSRKRFLVPLWVLIFVFALALVMTGPVEWSGNLSSMRYIWSDSVSIGIPPSGIRQNTGPAAFRKVLSRLGSPLFAPQPSICPLSARQDRVQLVIHLAGRGLHRPLPPVIAKPLAIGLPPMRENDVPGTIDNGPQ